MWLYVICIAESVVATPGKQVGSARDVISETAALSSVEAGVSNSADNSTYCRGVQPITIEPVDGDSELSDVEPLTNSHLLPSDTANTSTPVVLRQNTSNVSRPSADSITPQPAMRVVYCGTVSDERLLQQSALGGLAQNLVSAGTSSAPTSCNSTPCQTNERLSPGSHTAVVSSSDSGRKSKSRRTQPLDSPSSAARRRSVTRHSYYLFAVVCPFYV